MSATVNKNCLHLCGEETRCPGCGANCFVAEMPSRLCRKCDPDPKPQPQTPLELAIERLAEKLEGL